MLDPDPAATTPAQPRVIGDRYALARLIGRGAMGAVYAATRLDDQAPVAVKLVHAHLSTNEVNAARFQREARLTQSLDHPGIVRTYDAGTDHDGSLFLVMELLEGETFRDRMDSGLYTSHQALWIVTEVLRALAVAHRQGIVHRDLKPENVFLARRPEGGEVVKLLDFGIARELQTVSVTRTETTVGTPSYMAPEQATSAKTVGPTADVWAVGVVLYRVLTGQLPFTGDGPYEVVMRVCGTPHAPVLARAPLVDPQLAEIVERCLQKDPARRPADAAALLALLDPLVERPRGLSHVVAHPQPELAAGEHESAPLPRVARPARATPSGELAQPAARQATPLEAALSSASLTAPVARRTGRVVAAMALLVVGAGAVGAALLLDARRPTMAVVPETIEASGDVAPNVGSPAPRAAPALLPPTEVSDPPAPTPAVTRATDAVAPTPAVVPAPPPVAPTAASPAAARPARARRAAPAPAVVEDASDDVDVELAAPTTPPPMAAPPPPMVPDPPPMAPEPTASPTPHASTPPPPVTSPAASAAPAPSASPRKKPKAPPFVSF